MTVFGDRLRMLREEKGLTTEQLASELGIVRTTLTNYETGLRRPKPKVMESILDYFNVDLAWMDGETEIRNVYSFDGIYKAGYADGLKNAQKPPLSDDEKALLDDYRLLYSWEQAMVIYMVKALLSGNHSQETKKPAD